MSTVDNLPPAPSRSDPPATFISKADAFVAALATLVAQVNTALGVLSGGIWVTGTTYTIGDVRFSPIDFQSYRRKTAGAGATDPSLDTTNWQRVEVSANSVQSQAYKGVTTAGSSTAYTIAPTPAINAYLAPYEFDVSFHASPGANATLQISGLASPPNLVKQNPDGTYSNLTGGEFPAGWQSEVKLVSPTQALVRGLRPTSGLIGVTYYGIVSNATVTMTIASPCVLALPTGQFVSRGWPIVFTTSGALPTGIVAGTTYYVLTANTGLNNFTISATPGGAAINTTGSQSGTHSANNPTYNKATNNPSYVELEFIGSGAGGGSVTAVAGAAASGGQGGDTVKAFCAASQIMTGNIALSITPGGVAGSSGSNGGIGGDTSAVIFTGSVTLTANGGGKGQTGGTGSSAASTPKSSTMGTVSLPPTGVAATFIVIAGKPGSTSNSTASAATSFSGSGGDSLYGVGAQPQVGVTGSGNDGINPNSLVTSYRGNPGAGASGALGGTANNGGTGAPGMIIIREYA